MTDSDLDLSYTALCEALTAVGPERSELMLSMICLALMARCEQAGPVLELIARARLRLQEEAGG
jgi:hypothetical protein